eukprot:Tbor_TRINITY_DN4384_c0_g1::TRINITY_DN4384_c0_g1_i1::g.7640::m.7640
MTTSRINNGELRTLFNVFDIDETGLISPLELSNVFRCLGWSDITIDECENLVVQHFGPEIQQRANAVVPTEEGLYPTPKERLGINFEQLIALIDIVQLPGDSPVECFEAFKLFDMSRVGKISPSDLKCVSKIVSGRVSYGLVDQITKTADTDGDGLLSLEEFRQAVSKGGKGSECGFLELNQEMFVYPSATGSESQSTVLEPESGARSLNTGDRLGSSFRRARESKPAVVNEARTRVFGGVKILVDANNCVSKEAVREALGEFGYGPDTLDDETFDTIYKEQDVNGSGNIDVRAYVRLLESISEDSTETI